MCPLDQSVNATMAEAPASNTTLEYCLFLILTTALAFFNVEIPHQGIYPLRLFRHEPATNPLEKENAGGCRRLNDHRQKRQGSNLVKPPTAVSSAKLRMANIQHINVRRLTNQIRLKKSTVVLVVILDAVPVAALAFLLHLLFGLHHYTDRISVSNLLS